MLVALVAHKPEHVVVTAVISLLLAPGYLAFAYGLGILQGQQRFVAFNVFRTLPTIFYVGGILVVFLVHSAKLVPVMTMWVAANFVGGLLTLGVAAHGLPTPPVNGSPPSRSQMTKFGLKGFAGSVSPVDALRLDQAIVGLFLTPVALGLYVVAEAFTILPRLVGSSVGLVAFPQVAARARSRRRSPSCVEILLRRLRSLCAGGRDAGGSDRRGPPALLWHCIQRRNWDRANPHPRIALYGCPSRSYRRDERVGIPRPRNGCRSGLVGRTFADSRDPSPRHGVEGVALALTISWGASLLILVALAGMTGTRWASRVGTRWTSVLGFKSRRARVTGRQLAVPADTAAVSTTSTVAMAWTRLSAVARHPGLDQEFRPPSRDGWPNRCSGPVPAASSLRRPQGSR